MLSASNPKVAYLQHSLQVQQPQLPALELRSLLLALPPAWRAVVSSAPAATWFQVLSVSGSLQFIQDAQTGQLHTISPHLQLQQTQSEPVYNPSPVQVISWVPSRPWSGLAHQSAPLDCPLYLQGRLWGPHHLSLGVVGLGQSASPISWWSDKLANAHGSSGLLLPSIHWLRAVRLFPLPTSKQSAAETLQAMEVRWVASIQASSTDVLCASWQA